MLAQLLRKFRHNDWPETTAEAQLCQYRSIGNVENLGDEPLYAVDCTYSVNGHTYETMFMSPVEVKKGDKFPIRYNPARPERNSAEPYGDWEKYYDVVLVLVAVAIILFFYFKR